MSENSYDVQQGIGRFARSPVTNPTHDRLDTEAAWVKIPGVSPYEANALRKMTLEEIEKLEDRLDIARTKIEEARKNARRIVVAPPVGARVTDGHMPATVIPKTTALALKSYLGKDASFYVIFDNGAVGGFYLPNSRVFLL